MPSIRPPAKVLITGVSGYIGAWTARVFLERGYNVRGTVRSKSKGEWLAKQAWAKAAPGTFEYIVVKDIQADGAFDDAVKGDVTAVAHTASPAILDPHIDPYKLIIPAVKGTTGILESIRTHAPGVARVVITSSASTMTHQEPTEPRVFTEEDRNEDSVKRVETEGRAADILQKYRASKVKADKAAWDFVEQHKGKLNFEVTSIHPTRVYGPIIHEVASKDQLNATTLIFYHGVRNGTTSADVSDSSYVDVRDVARMHVDIVECEQAAGQKILAAAGSYSWQAVYDALHSHSNPHPDISVGTPGMQVKRQMVAYSNEKAKRMLGFEFTSLGDMAYDMVTSLKERGFW